MLRRLTTWLAPAAMLWATGCDDCPRQGHAVHVVEPDEVLEALLASCVPQGSDAGVIAALNPRRDGGAPPAACVDVCQRIYTIAVDEPAPDRLLDCSVTRNRDGGALVTITFKAMCR